MISEETYYVVDSLGVAHPETIERAHATLPQLFVEGGLGWMIGISLFLIALLLAAWKAPRWVREIGIGALIFAIFGTLLGILQVLDVMQMFGDISPAVLCGGLKVTLIPTFYGLIVYFISLIIRVIQKPRI
ncbi:MAG: MotA/TolQ/ExbB proton channel family protein [Bacteroidales bacterium]|nr:MotA/TolQ/ExbB proton channel family protein [Bacteroidales bacterium]